LYNLKNKTKKMERAELAKRYEATKKAIAEIENSNEVYLYATKDKYLPQVGYVHEIETISDLLNAQNIINSQKQNDFKDAAEMLGLKESEMPKIAESMILGLKASYWDKDLKTRLDELRQENRLMDLEKDLALLHRHLSDEDQFKIDMSKLSSQDLEM
jgi:DNA-binding XRE family transcriptional regulator